MISLKDPTFELRKKFILKYTELVKSFPLIDKIQNREFAFLFWDKDYMVRHRGFSNPQLFLSELKGVAPRHAYLSAALYNSPADKIMSNKGWMGCDFVVDIDSDHMDLSCQKKHDFYICVECDYVSKENITKCPKCEGLIRKQLWLCDECLQASKNEVIKLVDDFLPDFGIIKDNIILNFSGHRGYHIHLREEFIRAMNSEERRQIVDYMTATNFEPDDFFMYKQNIGSFLGSTIDDAGWKGRIANNFLKILNKHDSIESFDLEFGHLDLDAKIKHILFGTDKREHIRNQLLNKNKYWTIRDVGKIGWEKIKKFLLTISKCDIDVPVSIDTHRLIRVQGSIHGKTGFIVKPLDYYEMINFNPLSDPIVFSMDQKKLVKMEITTPKCPEIRIQAEYYGPYTKGEKIDLPEAVGVFLACKGVAILL